MKRLVPIDGKGNENLYRYEPTNVIYYRQSKAGKGRFERSTGTTNLMDARKIADKFRLELLGEKKSAFSRKLCGELFPEFIKQKEIKSYNTVQSIKYSWKHLKPFIAEMLPEEILPKWWEGTYIPQKKAQTSAKRKFFNDRKWLSMFLHSCKDEGLIDSVPKLVDPDPERKAGKVFTDQEIEKLLTESEPELHLQILMAVKMAMRKGEILGLEWERVDLDKKVIHLRAEDTKIRKARSFAIAPVVLSILKNRTQVGNFVFPSPDNPDKSQKSGIYKAWVRLKTRLKIKGRFHDLRHTFLTKAFKSGKNPALICYYAGLSLEEAQKTYLHFTPEDARCIVETVGEAVGENE